MTPLTRYDLPGTTVQPEGITHGLDRDFYVGSIPDGTIFRGQLDSARASVWQPPGVDDRTSVLGLALHGTQNLVACGGETGHVFVYALATGALVGRRSVPATSSLLNDVWVVGDCAYITDSQTPVIWRLPLGSDDAAPGEPEVFADLSHAGPQPYLNGIVATADESALLVAAQGAGSLWRVTLATSAVSEVRLPDGYRFAADGLLLLDPTTLLGLCAERTSDGDIVDYLAALRLDDRASTATPLGRWSDDRFDAPTTLARVADGRLLLVNSQLGRDDPVLPFRVIAMDMPAELR